MLSFLSSIRLLIQRLCHVYCSNQGLASKLLFCCDPYLLILYHHYLSYGCLIDVVHTLINRCDLNTVVLCLDVKEVEILLCLKLPIGQNLDLIVET